MKLGMIGLGRMGANMVKRLQKAGHQCVVYDVNQSAAKALVDDGAIAASSLEDFVGKLEAPRAVWFMVPVQFVDSTLEKLTPLLKADDVVVDGGNSYYHDDLRRKRQLALKNIHYMDVGVSGGVWGLERGYCLMIGGEAELFKRLEPIFAALAPGADKSIKSANPSSTAAHGYVHCGPSGAGHFVKMIHNGIEYGLMAAYAEGLNILRHANAGNEQREQDAETTPLSHPEHFAYDLNLAEITEVWRHGSVISSWLLDLTASALAKSPQLEEFAGRVSDSGEGRWTMMAAIDVGVPAPVLHNALASRFSSRGADEFANKVLSAMRFGFGGHLEKKS